MAEDYSTEVTLTPTKAAKAETTYRNLEQVVARAMQLLSEPDILEKLTDDELLEARDAFAIASDFYACVDEWLEQIQVIIERKLYDKIVVVNLFTRTRKGLS